jgi:uracil-DNA glycosylase family protein
VSGARGPREQGAGTYVPADADFAGLRAAAAGCQGCSLYSGATQTVFGAGNADARVVLVGEIPGDQEDRQGAPFVGPAGRLLDRALVEAGIDRGDAYVTNAVKHFKFKQAAPGKRRIHQTPDAAEIAACRPWLAAEFALLDPAVIVSLGAVAGKSLLGPSFRVTKQRGVRMPRPAIGDLPPRDDRYLVATIHPSAVIRADDRDAMYAGFLADLKVAAETLALA